MSLCRKILCTVAGLALRSHSAVPNPWRNAWSPTRSVFIPSLFRFGFNANFMTYDRLSDLPTVQEKQPGVARPPMIPKKGA